MNLDLKGKNALVCGASAGIGRASAIELALLGANVTVLARTEAKLLDTIALLDTSLGQQHGFIAADQTQRAELLQKVADQHAKTPFLILVNNSGGPRPGTIADAESEDFLAAYEQHLLVNHGLAQILLPAMRQAQWGRIINIISTSVKEPLAGLGVSNTTRWAVASWAKTLAGEVGQYGITVNNVLPGFTNTERLDDIIERQSTTQNKTREQVVQQLMGYVPAQRFGEPEEVAAAVAFLASPAAAYINGTNITVDGGRTRSV
jgi:3-oxoacyl-[acyl-carrier protein] reductase